MDSAVVMFGWLVFAWGAGIMAIALLSSFKRVRSPTRHVADALSGAVFCLLASAVVFGDMRSVVREALVITAIAAALGSWILGRYAKRVDRATRHARP